MDAAPRDPDTVRKVGGRKRYRLACTPDIGMGIALLVQLAQRRMDLAALCARREHNLSHERANGLGCLEAGFRIGRSEEHTSEPVTNAHIVCRLLPEKKKQTEYM